jgi:hypothetical protein
VRAGYFQRALIGFRGGFNLWGDFSRPGRSGADFPRPSARRRPRAAGGRAVFLFYTKNVYRVNNRAGAKKRLDFLNGL